MFGLRFKVSLLILIIGLGYGLKTVDANDGGSLKGKLKGLWSDFADKSAGLGENLPSLLPDPEQFLDETINDAPAPQPENAMVAPPADIYSPPPLEAEPIFEPIAEPVQYLAPSDIEADFFSRLNSEREARGLSPLAWDSGLVARARDWSATMANANSFEHSDLNPLLGTYEAAAENIAYGTTSSSSVHVAWMQSSGHRHNILAPNVNVVGVGVVCVGGTLWATQVFGRTSGSGLTWGFGDVPQQDPIARTDANTLKC